ncbi:MAG: M28 family peptidase [Rhodovarius sp.]|nr:M28 family metallopeptidase [Rhodovarius sp.]MDW8315378.1 M28 family peptidase [Rhodovarius sp.]
MGLEAALEAIAADPLLGFDFAALCDAGGRQSGTPSASSAFTFAAVRLRALGPVANEPSAYPGWTCHEARLVHEPSGRLLDSVPLLGSMPCRDLVLDVRDLGRGAPGHRGIEGLCVMVRHEYPFATHTLHRRVKLAAAEAAGAAAFLIAQPEPGVGPVAGSSGRNGGAGIPALGISAEAAAQLREGGRVRITIEAEDHPAETPNLILELPGRGPELVVLSAHLDGHALAESAIDNATGVAAAIAIARAFAPLIETAPRGLLVAIFGAEEWALAGSRAWLAGLDPARRARLVCNLNLDAIAGSPRLTALTHGHPALAAIFRAALPGIGIHEAPMENSDHANFAAAGIPAARLLAGFDEPESRLRFVLTGEDRRRLVPDAELRAATMAAARLLWALLHAPDWPKAALPLTR